MNKIQAHNALVIGHFVQLILRNILVYFLLLSICVIDYKLLLLFLEQNYALCVMCVIRHNGDFEIR